MFDIILSFITAFTLTYFAIPSIIHVAKVKGLCDEPGERRAHTETTPSLGGIAIFAGMIFPFELISLNVIRLETALRTFAFSPRPIGE